MFRRARLSSGRYNGGRGGDLSTRSFRPNAACGLRRFGHAAHHDAIYDEMRRSPSFAGAIARARAESAHGLAMQVVEIADAVGPHDNPKLVKNRCDQRRWLAGKYNTLYSDKLAVTDSDGGSIAGRLAKMSAAERAAWAAGVAAQARALLEAPTIDHEDR